MKNTQQNSERRVALILSLTISVDHWYGASGELEPVGPHVSKPPGSAELGSRHTVLLPARPALTATRPLVGKLRVASPASKLIGPSKAHQPKRAGEVQISGSMRTALIQRKASRFLRRAPGDLQNIEDNVDFMLGVPKIVWVILANVLAMAAWMGCIAAGLYLSRQPGNSSQQGNEDWERVSANNEAFVRDYREEYGFIPQKFSPVAYSPTSSGLLAQRPVYGDSQKYITGNSFYDQRHTAYDVPQSTSTGPTPTFFGGGEQFQDMRRQLRV